MSCGIFTQECQACIASSLIMKQYGEIRAERKFNNKLIYELGEKSDRLKMDKIARCDILNKTRQQYMLTLQMMIEERNLKLDQIKTEINKKTSEKINNLLATTGANITMALLSKTYDEMAIEFIPMINTMTIEIQDMLHICKKIDSDKYYLNRSIVPERDGKLALELGDEELEKIINEIESTQKEIYKQRRIVEETYKKEAILNIEIGKAEHHLSTCKKQEKIIKPIEKEDNTDSTSVTSDESEADDD